MSEENYKISIKVEEALLDYMCDKYQHSFNCLDEYDQQLVDSIASLESENARLKDAQRWIPVSERLPEAYEKVIALAKDCMNVDWVLPKELREVGKGAFARLYNVTHWMPLPESPEVQA